MTFPLKEVGDLLQFISGIIFFLVAVIFSLLFNRYKRRNYFLVILGSLAAAALMIVGNFDVLFPEDWDSELPELLSGIFSFILAAIIIIILLFPDWMPIKFEEELLVISEPEE